MSVVAEIVERREKVDFKHVLMATDFSSASRVALAYALTIARKYGSEVMVAHALPPEPREAVPMDPLPLELNRKRLDAEQELQRLENEGPLASVTHKVVLEQGSVWDMLSSLLQREEIDLLVLGTHGCGVLKKLALGSVAEEVLRLASCPVLTVGPKAMPPGSDKAEFKSILLATDFGPAATRAFSYALFLAETCRAKLVLLHMVPPMKTFDIGPAAYGAATYAVADFSEWQRCVREESVQKLKELLPPNAKLASQPEYVVETNFLPDGILDTAAAFHVGLIVMGANRSRSPRLASHIPWALTHDVLCEATCPVLTVRN